MYGKWDILLKDGYIVDGTGQKGWQGSLLISEDRIKELPREEIDGDYETIDCSGKVIAPGFIDAHSHNDWYLPLEDAEQFTNPFIRQGITTFIGGNCGFGASGFQKNTKYLREICNNPFKSDLKIRWSSMGDYFGVLEKSGLTANLACLAGHGTARTSLRGYDPSVMSKEEMKEMLKLLDEAMDDGAKGVSIGLQYEPGIFSGMDELKEVARLVKKRDKILTTHARASSCVSGTYPIKPFGKPHNILALKDMIQLARETGVRLQYSHFIFVGERTWSTFEESMEIVDKALSEGIDFKFDIYAYPCGGSVISVVLPEWFMAKAPKSYRSKSDLTRLHLEMSAIKRMVGFGYEDIQITYIDDPELKKFNGRFITDIAGELGLPLFETFMLFVERSEGKARVIQYKFFDQHILEAQMKHPASIFMTDAWVEKAGVQNPASFGCFPKFLQLSNENEILTLEEAVHKMTKAAADRFNIRDRGVLKKGNAADITVFNWSKVRDNTSRARTDMAPSGIEHVLINGSWALRDGALCKGDRFGVILR
ncbi:amidohydrolase family protein [Anoxybacterium hadale]|uniref:Amidohydrolase family protein n=1 Tax=Anoxybacterium hadale TaxID=3408580 RepID=A0ACD1AB30_9FIRM|nr:amidohydrolase family protein [Clostridiales bacterium]